MIRRSVLRALCNTSGIALEYSVMLQVLEYSRWFEALRAFDEVTTAGTPKYQAFFGTRYSRYSR